MSDAQEPLEKPLSPKARLFAERLGWSQDFNATRCAIDVGYREKSARKTASDLLADPRVKAIVDGIMAQRLAEARVRKDRVLIEIAAVAFQSKEHYEVIPAGEPNAGELRLAASAPPDAMRAVKKIKRKQWINSRGSLVTQTDYELHDKNAALALLGKLGGLEQAQKLEVTGKNGEPIAHDHTITVRFVKPGEAST